MNISADKATLAAYADGSNSYGVTATTGGRVDLNSPVSTTITSMVEPSSYTDSAQGNAYGIYADGKDSATVPTYSRVDLTSEDAEINTISMATYTGASSGVAVGVQITNGASVIAGSTKEGSSLAINGTSYSNASLVGVNSIGSTGIFAHEDTTINLNNSENIDTAAVNATGIAVSNNTAGGAVASNVLVGGNLEENVRSDIATATGIYVGGVNVTTAAGVDQNTGVTVNGNADITATTKSGTAYGVNVQGYENSHTSSTSKSYPAYVDFLGTTTDITAEAAGYGNADNPTAVGVNVTKGSVNFISRDKDGNLVKDSKATITATGTETNKTLGINAVNDAQVSFHANEIEITSAGDGIKVTDDSSVYAVAGSFVGQNYDSYTFEDDSSISITSHDNAVHVTDDSSVSLIGNNVDIEVTDNSLAGPTAVTVDDSGFIVTGKTVSITSEDGRGIEASGDSSIMIRSDYATENLAAADSSITIHAYDEAIHAVGESDVDLFSEKIDISVDGARETDVDALILDTGNHSLVSKDTKIQSTGNGIEALNGSKVTIVDPSKAASITNDFTEGSKLTINSNDEALYVNGKSKVTLSAETMELLSSSQLGTVQVENSGTLKSELEGTDLTTVDVTAKNLLIRNTYSSGSEGGFAGATLAAYSNTELNVSADTLVADAFNGGGDVIRSYGNAKITVQGDAGSVLGGNIVFAPQKEGEGTSATTKNTTGVVSLWLNGEDSEWEGRSYINNDHGSTSTLSHDTSGQLYTNYTKFDLGLTNGAKWTATGNSFFNTIHLNHGAVDASDEDVKNFIGAGRGTEKGLITVTGFNNELYINEDANISGLHIALMDGVEKPELIVDAVTAFDIDKTEDGTITEADNRLTFVSEDGVTRKGTLTIKKPFSISSSAFNTTVGVVDWETANPQNEFFDHYNFMGGTLVTEDATDANVDTQLRLNNIEGEGDVNVRAGQRVDVMPFTEGTKPTEAKTNLRKLTLNDSASFYAWNNAEVNAEEFDVGESGKVLIQSYEEDSADRTATEIETLNLGTDSTFDAINNKSVTITEANVANGAVLTVKDESLDPDATFTPVVATDITTLNIEKGGKFLADKNGSVNLETVNVADVDSLGAEAIASIKDSGEVTVTDLNLGDSTKVSATGNTSLTIENVNAGSTLATGSTGENASLTIQENTDVTVKNIATGDNATVTVTENTNTAQIGDFRESELTGVISLGSKGVLEAQDASLYAVSVTLGAGVNDSERTKLHIFGDSSSVTDGHYDNVKVSVKDLSLGDFSEVTLKDNKDVAITNVKAETGEYAKIDITGSDTVLIENLNLGTEAIFNAKKNATVTVENIATGEKATINIGALANDENKNTATGHIGYSEEGANKGVINLAQGATLNVYDASLNAKDFTLQSGASGTRTTAMFFGLGSENEANKAETLSVDTLTLGSHAGFYAFANKSVAVDTVAIEDGTTGENTDVLFSGNDKASVKNLNLAENAVFAAFANGDVTVNNVATGAKVKVLIGAHNLEGAKTESDLVNTKTALIGAADETGNTGVITLGNDASLIARDASVKAKTVTLADGDTGTVFAIIGQGKSETENHYDAETISIGTLNLGDNAKVMLKDNKSVNVDTVLGDDNAEISVTGSDSVGFRTVTLGREGNFSAQSNGSVVVNHLSVGEDSTVKITENTNTAQIGEVTDGAVTGVVSLGVNATLDATNTSLYACEMIADDGAKVSFTGNAGSETGTSIKVTTLSLGDAATFTSTNNKSVELTAVEATGEGAEVSLTGSDSLKVGSLNLGNGSKFTAENNGETKIQSITTGENANVTVHGATTGEAEASAIHALLGKVTLGASSTLEVTNAVLTGENLTPVDVTVAENAKFTLTSNKASSFINNLDVDGTFTASNATVNVETLSGNGNVNVGIAEGTTHTGANMYVKTLSMSGGSIYVDPTFGETSVLTVESLGDTNVLDTKITAGPGALVTIGAGSAEAAVAAVKANIEANSNSTNNLANAESLIYVAQPIAFGENGSLMSNPSATTGTTADAQTIDVTNGGALIVDQSKVGSKAFTGVTNVKVDDSSTLAVINVVAGTSFSLADDATTIEGTIKTVTDSPYVTANQKGRIVSLDGTATDTGLSVIASMGVQSMLHRADMVLAETVADRASLTLDSTKPVSLWADVRAEQYKQTSLGHGAGFKTDIGYGTVGAEVAPTETTSLGLAFQYGKGTVKGDLYSVKNKTKSYGATLYGSTMLGETGVKVTGELAYLKSSNDITNTYYAGLNQDLDAKVFSAGFSAQKTFELGSFDVTPSVGVRVSKLKTDAMKAGLSTIKSQSQTLVQVPVAVRFNAKTIETESGWGITPKFKLAVVPTFGDKSIDVFGNKRTVIDTSPVQGSLGVKFAKGNFAIEATANGGVGTKGTKSFGGKVGLTYRF